MKRFLFAVLIAVPALAADQASDIVKYRQSFEMLTRRRSGYRGREPRHRPGLARDRFGDRREDRLLRRSDARTRGESAFTLTPTNAASATSTTSTRRQAIASLQRRKSHAPSDARRRAMAPPIAPPAPVTMAARPSNLRMASDRGQPARSDAPEEVRRRHHAPDVPGRRQ